MVGFESHIRQLPFIKLPENWLLDSGFILEKLAFYSLSLKWKQKLFSKFGKAPRCHPIQIYKSHPSLNRDQGMEIPAITLKLLSCGSTGVTCTIAVRWFLLSLCSMYLCVCYCVNKRSRKVRSWLKRWKHSILNRNQSRVRMHVGPAKVTCPKDKS